MKWREAEVGKYVVLFDFGEGHASRKSSLFLFRYDEWPGKERNLLHIVQSTAIENGNYILAYDSPFLSHVIKYTTAFPRYE